VYKLTGDKEFFDWFEKVHDYTWTRFPDKNMVNGTGA